MSRMMMEELMSTLATRQATLKVAAETLPA